MPDDTERVEFPQGDVCPAMTAAKTGALPLEVAKLKKRYRLDSGALLPLIVQQCHRQQKL
jgi:hypothetical protein